MPELPEFVYKYMKLDQYFYDLISNQELYFSSPADFNDPFDSKLYVNPICTTDDLDNFIKRYPAFSILDKIYPNEEEKKPILRILDFKKNFTDSIQKLVNSAGIFCLSADPANLLLWSHYADCHKGLCIKFSNIACNIC